jgi:hypothetical protein
MELDIHTSDGFEDFECESENDDGFDEDSKKQDDSEDDYNFICAVWKSDHRFFIVVDGFEEFGGVDPHWFVVEFVEEEMGIVTMEVAQED